MNPKGQAGNGLFCYNDSVSRKTSLEPEVTADEENSENTQ